MNVRPALCLLVVSSLFLSTTSRSTAQELVGFKQIAAREIVTAPFTDGQVSDLLSTLDALLGRQTDPARWANDADMHLWNFVERVQAGELSPQQEQRVVDHLAQLAQQHPAGASLIEKQRHVVSALTIGKLAPDIVGKDLDGVEFSLSDYRGSIVVLTFSGEWCGACRAEYPYQRLLLELYKNRPLVLLSVNSDSDLNVARKAKTERGLLYRSWWDGFTEKNTQGPIASSWSVIGWPTVYVLDEDGMIRFVNLRQEDLLKGVKQLMTELSTKATKAHSGAK